MRTIRTIVSVVLSLLLLPVLAVGQTSPRLDSMTVAALNQLGIKPTGTDLVTLAKVYEFVNVAIEDVSTSWPAIEKVDTVVARDSVESAVLPSDFVSIYSCDWILGDSIRIPLEYVPRDSLSHLLSNAETAMAEPAKIIKGEEKFYYSTFAGGLYTCPKVWHDSSLGGSISLFVCYYARGAKLTAVGDTTTVLSKYRRYIRWHVCEQIDLLCGRVDRAAYWRGLYTAGLPPQMREIEGKK